MKLRLPLPPTINHYYMQRRRLRCKRCHGEVLVPPSYLSMDAKIFRNQVERLLMPVVIQERFSEGNLAVLVDWHPVRDLGDVDNRTKPLLDALEHGGLFTNDRQVKDLRTRWRNPVKNGAVDIEIWEI